jgi:predicted transcriptional regulator
MTEHVFSVLPDDDIARVCQVMENAGVRRVPVVDSDQRLLGIISMKDLAGNANDTVVGSIESSIVEKNPNN